MLRSLPVIPRTTRPSVAGTPVWYAEATTARTQLDISITIPAGDSRKLVVLWGSDGGEFPTAVTFDPTGAALAMIAIDGTFGMSGTLAVGAWYLDTPPTGSQTVRIATTNAVWSAASLKIYEGAGAGSPRGVSTDEAASTQVSINLEEGADLIDAYAETADIVLGDGLSDGALTAFSGQTAGADDVVNASFLATSSERTHSNSGTVSQGWSASSSADLVMTAVVVSFASGQLAPGSATELSRWSLDETGTSYADADGRSTATATGGALGGQSPLLADGGTSVSIQGTLITAPNHVDWQVASWSAEIYLQPRSAPGAGNRSILSKDSGLPVPGGWQVEMETTRAIDFYIRDATGLAGTAIHVTGASGDGDLSLDVAHVIHLTYDDATSTAAIYLDRTLLASTTNVNLAGLQNNTSVLSIGSRSGSSGVEFDGIVDRVTFFSGALTAAEVAARPAPTTITDPGPPSGITMQDISLGAIPPSANTDVDPADYATGLGAGNRDLTEITDPAARMSFLNDGTPTAQIRITTPAAPATTTNESASATIAEAGGPPSNVFNISWQRTGTGSTFPFVTTWNPAANHTGMATKPSFTAGDPASTAVTDPMSGLQMIRVGGDPGATVFRYTAAGAPVNTGLVFPNCLRNPNSPTSFKSINSDGTLLMISEFFDVGTQPGGTLCRAYVIDVTGQYSGGTPWRIIRASATSHFGETGGSAFYFWDPADPFRLFVKQNDGRVDAWYPIGTTGQSPAGPGTVDTWIAAPAAYQAFIGPANGRDHDNVTSRDGRWHMAGCQRVSDGLWGGIRVDLTNQVYVDPFVVSPAGLQATNRPTLRQMAAGSAGTYCMVQTPGSGGAAQSGVNIPGQTILASTPLGFAHPCWIEVNGSEIIVGVQGNTVYTAAWPMEAGPVRTVAAIPQANPTHVTPLLGDRFEDNGGTGSGATTGDRYIVQTRTGAGGGGIRSLVGVRVGPSDTGVVRFICDPRSVRTANYNETHAQAYFAGSSGFCVFPSNWNYQGNYSSQSVQPYVVLLPAGWASANNDGS